MLQPKFNYYSKYQYKALSKYFDWYIAIDFLSLSQLGMISYSKLTYISNVKIFYVTIVSNNKNYLWELFPRYKIWIKKWVKTILYGKIFKIF